MSVCSSSNPLEPRDCDGTCQRFLNLKKCFNLSALITSSLDPDEVLERIMSTSRQALGAETCSLLLADETGEELGFAVAQGPASTGISRDFRIQRGQGIAGWVFDKAKPLLIPNAYEDDRFNPDVDKKTGYRTLTILCVPLAVKNKVIGVAQLINKCNGQPFDAADLEMLELLAAQAAIAIDNARLHREMLTKQRIDYDLKIAEDIQRRFMPSSAPIIDGLDMAGITLPCDETGGDYFDFIEFPEKIHNKVGVAIGDVSGHGIPAALLMATARAFLRARAEQPGDISAVISDVNRLLTVDTGHSGRFMTLFYMVINAKAGHIDWIRAGHDPALIYDPHTDTFSELGGRGLILGVDGEWMYEANHIEGLSPGMILFLGTDGIWETRNAAREMYGKDRIREILSQNAHRCAADIINVILSSLDAFGGVGCQGDDVTMVVLKILPSSDESIAM
ncbi:PP2C family protein-serine/threonine phosphatase [Desulfovibrio inopinatus]|uniref:PP2C family protein-serine/threonine phosphatase n=1 Tax=Desulfovibrio inopinatus TaxID=102109 RepID=UPI00041E9D20|nr:GAF domain-containing SpoIIE family protein phosphatase [Desulfovibrio inopinatus]